MANRPTAHHTTSRVVAQTLETYGRDARLFLTRWGRRKYRRPPLLVEWLRLLPRRGVLLDLGCGGGQDSRYLHRVGYRVLGLDRTTALLQFAKARAPSVPFILADMRALPVRTGSLDGIWAAASLIHLPKRNVTGLLATLRHLLKPAGLVAVTVTYGSHSRVMRTGWMPGRFFARWKK
ncbi:MAG: class I SAM-dependent methyltransferase, partial [Nitrospiraceae bacterium]